ncbi:hypothetical protein M23134_01706 [Microscilla marina ATCC 23134]|uniref:Transposase n=1 Tax=Microscilla marina ATCC 23134 TaxID=313606 RepID=A1ZSX2_MICM2|nr:hypothetical protein M23134_01706 [Microscilla marina ATCC 23134]
MIYLLQKALEADRQILASWAYFHRESISKYNKKPRLLQEKKHFNPL